jgi:hypothetical protein
MAQWKLLFVLEIILVSACGEQATEPSPIAAPVTASADATVNTENIPDSAPSAESAGGSSSALPAESAGGSYALPAESTGSSSHAQPMEKPLASWRSWAPLCQGYPSKGNCDDGDATLFSGLLCLAGEEKGCQAVKAAQDTAGKFWRSPRRVGVDTSNSFSRDMALGVLSYLLATRDTSAAQAWIKWIDQNSVCQLNVGGVCQLRTYRFCRDENDGRCFITPGMWSMMRRVWENLELPLHKEMKTIGEQTLVTEAEQAPLGYALHLKAVIFFLYQKIGKNFAFEWDLINTIAERQPDNLFFQYLHEGSSPRLQEALRNLCPREAPEETKQWTWERDTAENAQRDSMGWDCIFLGRLL